MIERYQTKMQSTVEVPKELGKQIEQACKEENLTEAEFFRQGARRQLQALEVDND